jgi:hypothetical protein
VDSPQAYPQGLAMGLLSLRMPASRRSAESKHAFRRTRSRSAVEEPRSTRRVGLRSIRRCLDGAIGHWLRQRVALAGRAARAPRLTSPSSRSCPCEDGERRRHPRRRPSRAGSITASLLRGSPPSVTSSKLEIRVSEIGIARLRSAPNGAITVSSRHFSRGYCPSDAATRRRSQVPARARA